MAFCNKFGSLVRQSVSQNGQVQMASMLNSIRCMSSNKLFVGGLSYGTDDRSLKDAFSGFGEVISARVITDRDSGRSRGFGFVDFSNDESASAALSAMDGQELQGRSIRVSYAQDSSRGPRSFNNNNFRGNGRFGDENGC
ncbi:hypothetical protein P3X46_006471 [Hevea brasiliensis]|uniref:RRM domain-containing protein n=1 Tax=Hevea brasiliensis TaxID=3981 RepID=A0ABQ9K8K7_HEVBR|nr:glycine-rich RNA-binding protein 2, mitochondrial [Hevea brasiliensis]XP_058001270.1 glycine-rich RNA-binding protein 2, mitochondrial-like [Hevea brasiliensis]KAJ9129017.1 hypothetical protein P3X46_034217 [Hevea brasiliensis]KAJ9182479.1 hypothetical protein P3X46_006471 [Hevea brasiliensis]